MASCKLSLMSTTNLHPLVKLRPHPVEQLPPPGDGLGWLAALQQPWEGCQRVVVIATVAVLPTGLAALRLPLCPAALLLPGLGRRGVTALAPAALPASPAVYRLGIRRRLFVAQAHTRVGGIVFLIIRRVKDECDLGTCISNNKTAARTGMLTRCTRRRSSSSLSSVVGMSLCRNSGLQ